MVLFRLSRGYWEDIFRLFEYRCTVFGRHCYSPEPLYAVSLCAPPPQLQLWSSGDSWWHVLSARPSIPSGEKCFCALQSVVQWCNTGIWLAARSQRVLNPSIMIPFLQNFTFFFPSFSFVIIFVSSFCAKFIAYHKFVPTIRLEDIQ